MNIILQPFALLLGWLYSITGSYGLAIILFSLIFKILLFPISMKGRKSMLDMSRLSEKQKELQQKYGKDRVRYSQELQNLYTTENVKPSGGCLWSLLPLPILMALYFIISQPFTYLMGLTAEKGGQVSQLTEFILGEAATGSGSQLSIAQDVFNRFGEVQAALPEIANQITSQGGPIDFTMFGINLSATPKLMFWSNGITWAAVGLFLIPILSAVFSLLSMQTNMFFNKKILGSTTRQDTTNKQMMFMQPILSLWLGFTLPAALGLYWAFNAVFAILQEFCSVGILKKHVAKMRAEAEVRTLKQKEEERDKKRREAEQKKNKAEEARRIKMERKVSTDGISESRVGMRAYAKGRTFDQERYPVTPYHDPDDIIKEQRAALKAAREEAANSNGKKKRPGKPGSAEEETVQGMILNGEDGRDDGYHASEDHNDGAPEVEVFDEADKREN